MISYCIILYYIVLYYIILYYIICPLMSANCPLMQPSKITVWFRDLLLKYYVILLCEFRAHAAHPSPPGLCGEGFAAKASRLTELAASTSSQPRRAVRRNAFAAKLACRSPFARAAHPSRAMILYCINII